MSATVTAQGTTEPKGPALFVWPLFTAAPAERLRGAICVIVDQLRASSTITTALDHGAAAVHPCLEVEDAQALAATLRARGAAVKLGGERGGLAITGFDFGNLPREYGAAEVQGVQICFTTTNGTRAINYARDAGAAEVLIGCLYNRTAVAERAVRMAGGDGGERVRREIHILCAGTRGTVTLDDCLAAGAIAHAAGRVKPRGADLDGGAVLPHGDDTARMHEQLWLGAEQTGQVEGMLVRSRGGRNLARIGMSAELPALAEVDCLQTVPRLVDGVLVKG
jgi:2-phosphosulfolactate phosphatase